MPKKTTALSAAERRQIEVKFSLTPQKIAAELAKAKCRPGRKPAARPGRQ
jgi:hypothetical protein